MPLIVEMSSCVLGGVVSIIIILDALGGDTFPAASLAVTVACHVPSDTIISRPYPEPNIWRGFYVFGVNPDDGFNLKGKIEHDSDNNYYYGYSYGSRSFYIGDVLYTVSPNLMKMNDLNDINHEINQIKLDNTGKIIPYLK